MEYHVPTQRLSGLGDPKLGDTKSMFFRKCLFKLINEEGLWQTIIKINISPNKL
jgi:hypothetical protein